MSRQLTAKDLTTESAVALFTPGTVAEDLYGNTYQYLQANGAKVAYNLYSIHGNTGTASTSYQVEDIIDLTNTPANTEGVPACCPQIAMTDNYYAWVFVGPGDFTATAGEEVTADQIVYGHATAGAVGDTAVALVLPGVTAPVTIASGKTGILNAAQRLWAYDLA